MRYALESDPTAWILAQRPARTPGDAFKPYGFFLEDEPAADGRIVKSGCIFLTNKECPWRCLMCDLWKHTLTKTVPLGAIPKQIEYALKQFGTQPDQLKLYNSGSFFDPAAIPPADYPAIARKVWFANHLIVESHPRLIGEKVMRFRDLLSCSLEVAMGLETVHPGILPLLNKRFDLAHFERAANFLRKHQVSVRAFVLVGLPYESEQQGIEWAVKSAEFAFRCGAGVVSLIPTRLGNGALERLSESGDFAPPQLSSLELALALSLGLGQGRVFADTWNLEQFSACPACLPLRRDRLHAMNLTQKLLPTIECSACNGQAPP